MCVSVCKKRKKNDKTRTSKSNTYLVAKTDVFHIDARNLPKKAVAAAIHQLRLGESEDGM
jgi:hypothetical protein